MCRWGRCLTTGEGPLTQEGVSFSRCPVPYRSIAVATERGDLAALQLECYVPAPHAPVLGRYCLISAPPVLLWSQVWGRHGESGVLLHEQDALLTVGTKAVPGERETPKIWPAGLGLPFGITTSGYPLGLL